MKIKKKNQIYLTVTEIFKKNVQKQLNHLLSVKCFKILFVY